MESTYDFLAKHLVEKLESLPRDARLIIAIAGIPGSGKSTLSQQVIQRVSLRVNADVGRVLPMDGFHLYKSELDNMENPSMAHAHRGAHFTFNPNRLLELVKSLRERPHDIVMAPSFDHAIGDPVENDVHIGPQHRIILLEGLYLHAATPPWSDIYALCDERWFIQIPLEFARDRVGKRHVATGLAPTLEMAWLRWDKNDRLNGEYVLTTRLPATFEIMSICT
ncbi:hypothetical protein SpCBS45565_g06606 [Spizellomyces sp. 'palustris']|nr:hypothetical protein SpCBS45565_g06606 [Spizellomyces sp. 'palustris']